MSYGSGNPRWNRPPQSTLFWLTVAVLPVLAWWVLTPSHFPVEVSGWVFAQCGLPGTTPVTVTSDGEVFRGAMGYGERLAGGRCQYTVSASFVTPGETYTLTVEGQSVTSSYPAGLILIVP